MRIPQWLLRMHYLNPKQKANQLPNLSRHWLILLLATAGIVTHKVNHTEIPSIDGESIHKEPISLARLMLDASFRPALYNDAIWTLLPSHWISA